MRKHGLLPVLLLIVMVLAVYVGYSQGHSLPSQSLMSDTPLDGGVFLLLSVALIYGGKVLYGKD